MIYAVLLCYIASGNCITPGGPMSSVFSTLDECLAREKIMNRGYLKSAGLHAYCFEKPSWRPIQKVKPFERQRPVETEDEPEPSNEIEQDQSGPSNDEATRLLNESQYQRELKR